MKRFSAVVMTAVLAVAMAGCNSPFTSNQPQPSVEVSQVQVSAEPAQTSKGITALYVMPDSCKIEVSEKRSLSVSSDKGSELPNDLIFVCDDESIAVVDSLGRIIGKKPGDCVITISRKDQPSVNVKVPVTVKPQEESSAPESSVAQVSRQESQQSSSEERAPTIIYNIVPPSSNSNVSVPTEYVYYWGRNNFSYDRVSDGYLAYSLVSDYLSSSDVSRISDEDAQLLINTIYAKYGYIFSTPKIKRFFEAQSWYYPQTSNMSSVTSRISSNSVDNYNLNLLKPIRDS